MSTEKKVLFLFLALIVLIITCVFTHIGDFKVEEKVANNTHEEVDESPSVIGNIKNKVKSLISSPDLDFEEVVDKKIQKEEESKVDETIKEEVKDESTNSEEISLEEKKIDEKAIVEEEKEEVAIEEKVEEPLITTDKRYKRTGNEKNIEDLSKDAQLLQIKMAEYVKENPIIFKRGSNKITKSSNKTIKLVVEALKEYPNMRIEVAGHTDAIGAAKLNKSISEQRAVSVKKRLVYFGIDSNRIKARGYGEDIPLVKNSKNGYSKINRRVEFNIIEE